MSPALTPSSLSTVPMSKLPEILPGTVKERRCCPGRLEELSGCSTVSTTQLSAWGDKRSTADSPQQILLLGLKTLSGAWEHLRDMRRRELGGLSKVLRSEDRGTLQAENLSLLTLGSALFLLGDMLLAYSQRCSPGQVRKGYSMYLVN